MKTFVKDPQASLDYSFDWTRWLNNADTISSSSWSVPAGLDIVSGSEVFSDTLTTVELSGGTLNSSYVVTNTVTTNEGLIDERSFKLVIKNR